MTKQTACAVLSTTPLCDIGLQFFYKALHSQPFFPSGQCVLMATAVCVPCGVVSASTEPSSWRTAIVLIFGWGGVVLRFLLPTPLSIQVVHHMSRLVSVCVRPMCSSHPCVVLVVHDLPHHVAMCVRPKNPTSPRGAHGHCTHLHAFGGCRAHLQTTAPGYHGGFHGQIPVWVPLLILKAVLFPGV